MTTKKQRRAAVEAKHGQWVEDRRQSGLKAQQEDKARRDAKARQSAQSEHDKKKHSPKKLDKNCIICQDLLLKAAKVEEAIDG